MRKLRRPSRLVSSPLPGLAILAVAALIGLGQVALAQAEPPAPAAPAATRPVAPAPVATPGASVPPEVVAPPALSVPATPAAAAAPGSAGEVAPAPADAAMPMEPAPAAATPGIALPHDLSPWGMFMAADWVVKAVMLGLAFASVVTWTIWLAKSLELMVASRRLRRALRGLLASATLEAGHRATGEAAGPATAMVRVTELELQRSGELPAEGIKERVAISLGRIEAGAGRRITRGTGILATIGATAPFVGLFGTVWGIMNSFIGIAKTQTTNLAVVAPGIAEALLATAIGLVAAIPAVIIYNHFSRQVSGYRALLGDTSAEMLRLLSRDLDRRDVARAARQDTARQETARQEREVRERDARETTAQAVQKRLRAAAAE
ncbi:tonB-system energizer ExbB [Ancylobacter lacus]|uniref:tonB-system energizer ExbB n=1 Tax=Ancylobacter lacus TaxID=2579970 RepID=UPI001BCD37D9|nr:tonB-system energizer ExbB [Ancylobacter lacus]MBS7539480.1 tonB-system energizer ExbB [Ancylobacter lacus]